MALLALLTLWVQVDARGPDLFLRIVLHLGQAGLAFAVLAFSAAADSTVGALRR